MGDERHGELHLNLGVYKSTNQLFGIPAGHRRELLISLLPSEPNQSSSGGLILSSPRLNVER